VYVAARAPDAEEDYAVLASKFPTPPATAGIVFDGDEGRLTEAAFLRDFAGDLPEARARVLYAVQQPFHKALLTGKTKHASWRSKPSFYVGFDFAALTLSGFAPWLRCCAGPTSCRLNAVPMSARWENACGKLPSCRRAVGSYSSASRPTSLRSESRRSKRARASASRCCSL